MKIIKQNLLSEDGLHEHKPYAVITETGAVIREFYNRVDAYDWLEHTLKFQQGA